MSPSRIFKSVDPKCGAGVGVTVQFNQNICPQEAGVSRGALFSGLDLKMGKYVFASLGMQ